MTTQLPDRPPTSLSDTDTSLRVLLAANSKVYQMLLTRLLEAAGHRVVIVHNGKEAVAAFCSQPFDLILTEVQMPGMSGPEAAALIRVLEQGTVGHVPIVAVTADPGDCPRTDIDYCLPKPVCPDSLCKAIAEVIGTRSAGNTFSASTSADCGPLVKAHSAAPSERLQRFFITVDVFVMFQPAVAKVGDADRLEAERGGRPGFQLGIDLGRHLVGEFAIRADSRLMAFAVLVVAQVPDSAAQEGADPADTEGLLGWLGVGIRRHGGYSSEELSATKRYKRENRPEFSQLFHKDRRGGRVQIKAESRPREPA